MLLRFLQEGEGRPVGAARSVTVDVRVIAATHRDLEAGVERGTFREDFYYRLWWAVLEVPPLRERREDIALLVEHFRSEVNDGDGLGLDITGVTREAMAILEGDDWPGNVRELEAVVKRAMVCRRAGWVGPEDIVLPRLRRDRLPESMRALGIDITSVQEQALRLALSRGAVRRGDLMARCGISRGSARKALLGLERAGVLRREGEWARGALCAGASGGMTQPGEWRRCSRARWPSECERLPKKPLTLPPGARFRLIAAKITHWMNRRPPRTCASDFH